jgi:predicted enzyme related to lactoylglutathione lyase
VYSVCMWKLAFVERSLGTFVAPVPRLVQYPSASTRQAVRSGCESYIIRMANTQTSGPAKLGYVIMYVPDVEKTVDWYSKAFGLSVRRIDDSRRWAEMETGSTTLAFTPLEQREADITGGVKHPAEQHPRANIELNLLFPDLDATFKVSPSNISCESDPVFLPLLLNQIIALGCLHMILVYLCKFEI